MTRIMLAALLIAAPASAQTQARINADAAADYRAADAAMTAAWKRAYAAMKALDADGSRVGFGHAAAMLASQRAWLGFRDAQCVVEAGEFAGGSMQPAARTGCLARLTRERTVQLTNLPWTR